MQKLKVYAIFDSKSKSFSSFNIANDERVIKNSILTYFRQSHDSMIYNFATDYSVYELGYINDDGTLVPNKVECFTLAEIKELSKGEEYGSK